MITFEIHNIIKDPACSKLKDDWDVLINIEGDLKVYLDGYLFFDEPMMTIVELAVELGKWLQEDTEKSFKYETIDDEEQNIFNIVMVAKGAYQLNSAWQERSFSRTFGRADVVSFASNYIDKVVDSVNEEFGVNLRERFNL